MAEKTKKYIAQGRIKHNGKLYEGGQEIELTEEEAALLLKTWAITDPANKGK